MRSPAYRLIEIELGRDLAGFVLNLRMRGHSWRETATLVTKASGIPVTHETLRGWFGHREPAMSP